MGPAPLRMPTPSQSIQHRTDQRSEDYFFSSVVTVVLVPVAGLVALVVEVEPVAPVVVDVVAGVVMVPVVPVVAVPVVSVVAVPVVAGAFMSVEPVVEVIVPSVAAGVLVVVVSVVVVVSAAGCEQAASARPEAATIENAIFFMRKPL